MTKKILMVGVLDVPSSTNVFMAKGFEQLGYEVVAYNYRTRAMELGLVFNMWTDFRQFLKGRKYDLIVFCKTNSMHPELVEYAKCSGPTWYWFMDPLATAEATIADEYAKFATYASATSSEVQELFKKVNDKSFQIIEGYDPDVYFYEDSWKVFAITFIGNATPKRIKDILALKKAIGDTEILIAGLGWPKDMGMTVSVPMYNENERYLIHRSRIVLNLCQDKIMFSDRVVKSLACGALVLSQYCADLETHLAEIQNGNEPSLLQLWDTPESAHHLINLYLANDGISKHTRQTLANYMKENYSWKAVCKQIMEKVK